MWLWKTSGGFGEIWMRTRRSLQRPEAEDQRGSGGGFGKGLAAGGGPAFHRGGRTFWLCGALWHQRSALIPDEDERQVDFLHCSETECVREKAAVHSSVPWTLILEHPCTKRTSGFGALIETTLLGKRLDLLTRCQRVRGVLEFPRGCEPAYVSFSELKSPRVLLVWTLLAAGVEQNQFTKPSAAPRRIFISPGIETDFHFMILIIIRTRVFHARHVQPRRLLSVGASLSF